MKQITVTQMESGQRLDKLLARYMRKAPKSFLYKMLRKKNITLNGCKAEGNEILDAGDQIKLFLSDETYEKFGGVPFENVTGVIHPDTVAEREYKIGQVPELIPGVSPPEILYQDEHILLFHKPANMLSQKAKADDVSLVEYLNAYLLESGCMSFEQMQLVHPSICNRLDRNTSGMVIAGISLAGLQTMNRLLKERSIRKYYRCIVCGAMHGNGHLSGYLSKDEKRNRVTVTEISGSRLALELHGARQERRIETEYRVLFSSNRLSLLEVHLITGRSHQIRAHLASIGHPVLGDRKYGDAALNRVYAASHGVNCQLLHAYRLEFPQVEGPLSYLSGKTFCDPMPALFTQILGKAQEVF